jgi:hypothetical protein
MFVQLNKQSVGESCRQSETEPAIDPSLARMMLKTPVGVPAGETVACTPFLRTFVIVPVMRFS